MMKSRIQRLAGELKWSGIELYRDLFIERSDQKKLERALRKLQHAAHEAPLREEGKRIVVFQLRPHVSFLAYENIMAAALRNKGHHVSYFTCRKDLAFCMLHNVNVPEVDRTCHGDRCLLKDKWIDERYPAYHLGPMSQEARDQCRRVDALGVEQCQVFSWRGMDIGRYCMSSMNWYLRRSYITDADVEIWRSSLKTAVHVMDRFEAFLDEVGTDVVLFHNAARFTERICLELCRRRGVRGIDWGAASFHMRFLASQNIPLWEALDAHRESLHNVCFASPIIKRGRKLLARWKREGGCAGYAHWRKRRLDQDALSALTRSDVRPFAVAYTNTTYEQAILPRNRIYGNQFEWSAKLVEYFRAHPEYRLIIRVHPAERIRDIRGVREWYLERMQEYVREWPENVAIVPTDADISSYGLAEQAQVALTYVSTIAMELVDRGVPVITAACCHYEGRGFTTDPQTESDYLAELDRHMQIRQEVTTTQRQALLNYVSWLIYVRHIQFEPLEWGEGESYLRPRKIRPDQVFSGKLTGLEKLCRLILEGHEWWTIEEMIKSGLARRISD